MMKNYLSTLMIIIGWVFFLTTHSYAKNTINYDDIHLRLGITGGSNPVTHQALFGPTANINFPISQSVDLSFGGIYLIGFEQYSNSHLLDSELIEISSEIEFGGINIGIFARTNSNPLFSISSGYLYGVVNKQYYKSTDNLGFDTYTSSVISNNINGVYFNFNIGFKLKSNIIEIGPSVLLGSGNKPDIYGIGILGVTLSFTF